MVQDPKNSIDRSSVESQLTDLQPQDWEGEAEGEQMKVTLGEIFCCREEPETVRVELPVLIVGAFPSISRAPEVVKRRE